MKTVHASPDILTAAHDLIATQPAGIAVLFGLVAAAILAHVVNRM